MIADDFKEILEKFPIEKENQFKNNWLANKFRQEFTDNLKSFVKGISHEYENYIVRYHFGVGTWFKWPWIQIQDPIFGKSVNQSLFLNVDFNFDKQQIYFMLNQVENNQNSFVLKERSEKLFNSIRNPIPEKFLHYNQDFSEFNWEVENRAIITKVYNFDEINDRILKKDMESLLKIGVDLIPIYNKLINDTSEKTIIPSNNSLGDVAKKILNCISIKNLNYDEIDKENKILYKKFQEKYAPEVLKNIHDNELLTHMFLHEGNKDNLSYALEFNPDYIRFGSIGEEMLLNMECIR